MRGLMICFAIALVGLAALPAPQAEAGIFRFIGRGLKKIAPPYGDAGGCGLRLLPRNRRADTADPATAATLATLPAEAKPVEEVKQAAPVPVRRDDPKLPPFASAYVDTADPATLAVNLPPHGGG